MLLNGNVTFCMICVVCMYYIYMYVSRDHDSQPLGCEWATRFRVGLLGRNRFGPKPPKPTLKPYIKSPTFPHFPHLLHKHIHTLLLFSLTRKPSTTSHSLPTFGSSSDFTRNLGQDHHHSDTSFSRFLFLCFGSFFTTG